MSMFHTELTFETSCVCHSCQMMAWLLVHWNFPDYEQRRYNYEQGHLEMSHIKGIIYIIGSCSALQSAASLASSPTRLPRQTESPLLWIPGLLSQG